jgi:hypothetical protein
MITLIWLGSAPGCRDGGMRWCDSVFGIHVIAEKHAKHFVLDQRQAGRSLDRPDDKTLRVSNSASLAQLHPLS